MDNEQHANEVKKSVENVIGVSTFLKRKKKSEEDNQREKFIKVIQLLEEVEVRSVLLGTDLQLDFSMYNEKFYMIIDMLFGMFFSKESCELIFYYLYDRVNPDGSFNELLDSNNNVVPLTSPSDLWYLIQNIEKGEKAKKKS